MTKKKRRKAAKKEAVGYGFDFGDQQTVLTVPDPEFNQALLDANVFACAYGYDRVTGYPPPMPVIWLVAEHADPLRRAFEIFARWGCEQDGDVLDIQIMLRNDGSYIMAISPEVERAQYRINPHHQLVRPLTFGISWVKIFDTTNPYLSELASYGRSWLAPVSISAGVADLSHQPPDINSLKHLSNLPRVVKFNLKIYNENDSPDSFLLQISDKKGKRKNRSVPERITADPKEYARLRRKVIDIAFPVSRERIRRAELIKAVRSLAGFENLHIDQIEQASTNLVLSNELTSEKPHFIGLGSNFREIIWNHILDRIEHADDDNRVASLDPVIVAAQARLDVQTVLSARGVPTEGKKFSQLQALFKRKGYVSD